MPRECYVPYGKLLFVEARESWDRWIFWLKIGNREPVQSDCLNGEESDEFG